MTLFDAFKALSGHPLLLYILLTVLPAGAFMANIWSGVTTDGIWAWRYVYTSLIYLACITGVFAVTLNVYLLLFAHQSLWDVNLPLQVLPILTMVTTLLIIKQKIPFRYIPGFGKLYAFLSIIAGIMSLLWFIDRTHIYALSYLPFLYLLFGFIALLIVIRFASSRIF